MFGAFRQVQRTNALPLLMRMSQTQAFMQRQMMMTRIPMYHFSASSFPIKINRQPLQTDLDILKTQLPKTNEEGKVESPECYFPGRTPTI